MRVFIDKERAERIKGIRGNFDELYKDLLAEESRCNGCHHQYNVSVVYCRNCEIYGSIKALEKSIRELLKDSEE